MSQLITLLTVQESAALISFAAGTLVVAVVIFLIKTAATDEDKVSVKHKVYKLRGRYFFALALCIIAGLLISLRLLPYPVFQDKPDEVVTVVGMQWMWKMSPGLSDKDASEFTGAREITLPVNKNIQFVVTAADVNHNFAIYNSEGVLLTQTQAMPEYYNELQYVFTEKGDYPVLCLEYCGIPHAYMVGMIHIN